MVGGKFCFSLARAVAYEGNRVAAVLELGSPYTDEARDKLLSIFEKNFPEVEYFLMVDADIEFEKDAISRTIYTAEAYDADVVWGNYALGSFSNSIYAKDQETDLAVELQELNPDKVYEGVYTGGTGWCLINRRILPKLRERAGDDPWPFFKRDIIQGEDGKPIRLGEDISFGRKVHQVGGKQVGYTGVVLIHHKLHATVPQFMRPLMEEVGKAVIPMTREG